MKASTVIQIILIVVVACVAIVLLHQGKTTESKPALSDEHSVYVEPMKTFTGRNNVDPNNTDTVYVSKPLDQTNVGGNVTMIYRGMRYEFLVTAKKPYMEKHK